MTNTKPFNLAIEVNMKLAAKGALLPKPDQYRRLIGKLFYLTITRPDMCYTIQMLSQFMQQLTRDHVLTALHVLWYLKKAPDQGFLAAGNSKPLLATYCNSDWAGCTIGRKSTYGYCAMLGSSPISWRTKEQFVVSR